MKYIATVDGQEYTIEIESDNQVVVNGQPVQVDFRKVGSLTLYSLLLDNHSFEVVVEDEGRGVRQVVLGGNLYRVRVEDERTRRLSRADRRPQLTRGEVTIKAPIPGMVVKLLVAPGDTVFEGQGVAILEAMKMENELCAPRGGTVHEVRASPGEVVDQGQILVTIQ